jgi:hypothetical protein
MKQQCYQLDRDYNPRILLLLIHGDDNKKVNEEHLVTKLPWEPTDVTFVTCLRHEALRDGSWELGDKVVVGQRRK